MLVQDRGIADPFKQPLSAGFQILEKPDTDKQVDLSNYLNETVVFVIYTQPISAF